MGFTVLPTNIGGVNLNSIAGPLASLLNPQSTAQNLLFPSDLGANPSMGHAVIISAYDYYSELGNAVSNLVGKAAGGLTAGNNDLYSFGSSLIGDSFKTLGQATQAPNYSPVTKGVALATVSMFMPETVNISYNSSYSDISITEELGLVGFAGNAVSDINKQGLSKAITPYGIAGAAKGMNALAETLGGKGGNVGTLAAQGAGVFVNPQMQLLYRGVGLRSFQLEFIMTPKSAAEAKTVKDICDSLTFYSLPGISGAQRGGSGQFLTPPQIFQVQFKFLGKNGITGTLSNVISSALSSSGLGFLTAGGGSAAINSAAAAKTYTVGNCVLEDVNIDYAPNGWAAYNDGYPVQTRLTLHFKETTMITKDAIKNQAVQDNYNNNLIAQGLGYGDIGALNDASDPTSKNFIGI